ncbi:hypothetical protein, partial [Nostoc sp.]|uniref:hypothetical protein n=1 Tax=Nostoc sp. TaxID=1180 RepID=UPI002FF5D981
KLDILGVSCTTEDESILYPRFQFVIVNLLGIQARQSRAIAHKESIKIFLPIKSELFPIFTVVEITH